MKGAGSLFRVADDRDKQMRKPVVDVQLDLFRVNKYQLDLFGLRLVKQAGDYAVDADRFTHTGGTGNEQMRHFRNVKEHRLPGNIDSEGNIELALRLPESLGIDKLAQIDRRNRLVRHLNADGSLSGDRRFDSYPGRGKVEGNVVNKIGDSPDPDPLLRSKLVSRYRRSAGDIDYPCPHPEAGKSVHQLLRVCVKLVADVHVFR